MVLKNFIQGLSISTPLNINFQIQALKSLEKVLKSTIVRLERPITNKVKNKNWEKLISNLKLDQLKLGYCRNHFIIKKIKLILN